MRIYRLVCVGLFAFLVVAPALSVHAAVLGATPAWTYVGVSPQQGVGTDVAVGDVNGDGYADLIVPGFNAGFNGKVFVFFGSSTGPATTPSQILTSPFSNFGRLVAFLGDWNGDGYGDLALSSNAGDTVEIRFGSPAGLPASAGWTTTMDCCSFGKGLSEAGDINDDGFADLLVGAPNNDQGGLFFAGKAYLFLGGPAAATTPAWTYTGTNQFGLVGDAMSGAGDVNGDGFGDIILSDKGFLSMQGNPVGQVLVFLGQAGGAAASPVWTNTAPNSAVYGWAVGAAGDVNGDGFGDILVGDNQYGRQVQGKAYLYLGSSAGPSHMASWTFTGDSRQAAVGANFASGDIDQDGYSDVIVSAPQRDSPGLQQGRIYLFRGGVKGLSRTAAWFVDGPAESAGASNFPLAVGDVNADTLGDLVVGAPAFDGAFQDVGRADLFLGGAP